MTKFLIILLLITIGTIVVVSVVMRKLKNFLSQFTPPEVKVSDSKENVIYQKDDIVVLKGDAKKDFNNKK